jgi:hypothetical protein
MHISLTDMLMCLNYVINNFHCLYYIHTVRQMKIQIKEIISNLSAKRSNFKPSISKTSPMTPYFLYNFVTLLRSTNQKYNFQKIDISPNVRNEPLKILTLWRHLTGKGNSLFFYPFLLRHTRRMWRVYSKPDPQGSVWIWWNAYESIMRWKYKCNYTYINSLLIRKVGAVIKWSTISRLEWTGKLSFIS